MFSVASKVYANCMNNKKKKPKQQPDTQRRYPICPNVPTRTVAPETQVSHQQGQPVHILPEE